MAELDEEDIDLALLADAERDESQSTQRMLARLRASQRIVYDQIQDAITEEIRAAIIAERPVLLIVRLAAPDWAQIASTAIERVISAIHPSASDVAIYTSEATAHSRSLRVSDMLVIGSLYNHHVCCLVGSGDELPPAIGRLRDLDMTIPALSWPIIECALRRRYPDEPATWPRDLDAAGIDPSSIDLAFRKAGDAASAIQILRAITGPSVPGESASVPSRDEGRVIRLEDLHGYGEAKNWGLQLAADLGAFGRGELPWSEIDSGCLLVGPPGTGKTLFASATAATAGCHFIPTSYADWQASRGGHLGDVIKRLRQIFTDAAAKAPSIVFIDEIDTLPARGSTERHDDWWRSITNALLECLDGTGRREGVVILAACNDGTNLDPALVRSGRLDRRFRIELPDEVALTGILGGHLGGGLSAEAIEPIAIALAGSTSGADAMRIARDARRLARKAGRALTAADLLAAAIPAETRSPALLRRIAIHEAGHAVVRMLFGTMPLSLTLISSGPRGGSVDLGIDHVGSEGRVEDIVRSVIPLLAGRAAEEVVLGSPSGGAGGSKDSDLAQATDWLARAEAHLGLGSRLLFGSEADGAGIEIRLRRLYAETLMLVSAHRPAIVALADLALEKRVLGRTALAAFAREHGLQR